MKKEPEIVKTLRAEEETKNNLNSSMQKYENIAVDENYKDEHSDNYYKDQKNGIKKIFDEDYLKINSDKFQKLFENCLPKFGQTEVLFGDQYFWAIPRNSQLYFNPILHRVRTFLR